MMVNDDNVDQLHEMQERDTFFDEGGSIKSSTKLPSWHTCHLPFGLYSQVTKNRCVDVCLPSRTRPVT